MRDENDEQTPHGRRAEVRQAEETSVIQGHGVFVDHNCPPAAGAPRVHKKTVTLRSGMKDDCCSIAWGEAHADDWTCRCVLSRVDKGQVCDTTREVAKLVQAIRGLLAFTDPGFLQNRPAVGVPTAQRPRRNRN